MAPPYATGDIVAFTSAVIIAGDDMEVLRNAALNVQDGRIIAIGAALPGARNVDLGASLLCPMFVNSHTHVGDSGAKEMGIGLRLEEAVIPPHGLKHRFLAGVDSETLVGMMRDTLLDMLLGGTIAFADFREQGLAGVRALRRAAADLPIRAVILGRMAEKASMAEMEREAHALLAEADGLGIREVGAYPPELMRTLRDRYPDRLFAVHAAESRSAQEESLRRTGRTEIARVLDWEPDLIIHLVHATAGDLAMVARRKTGVVSCPRSNGILGDGFPDLAAWHSAGIAFALGTDNVMFVAPDMLREMDFASRLGRGLAEDPTAVATRDILRAATIEGARALRLERELGSLAPGKQASFIAFNLDQPHLRYQHDPISALVHRAGRADIGAIYVAGQKLSELLPHT
ncbi:MAG: amidohydrolase family protein [Aggregatilineaceae bacterium]